MNSQDKKKNGISRREFVRGAGAGTVALAGAGALPTLKAQASGPSAIPEQWDLEADGVGGRGDGELPVAHGAYDVDQVFEDAGHLVVVEFVGGSVGWW